MACNLPIFSFDIGDVNEYAGHLKPGHVAKNNNKIELYEKLLLHLSSDPNKRSNGRTKIEKLSWDIYAIEVEKIYFETLGIDTQNYPNPFNPVTSLRYDLPEDGLVNITIYDMMGRVVKRLVNSSQTAGYKSIK